MFMLLLLFFCLIFPYYKHYTFLIISILTQKVHLYTKQKNKSPFLNGLSFVLIMWALRSNLPLQLYCSAHVYYDIVFTNEDFFNECFLSSVETFVTKSMVSPALWVQSNEVSCEKGTSSCWAVCCEPNLRGDDTAGFRVAWASVQMADEFLGLAPGEAPWVAWALVPGKGRDWAGLCCPKVRLAWSLLSC